MQINQLGVEVLKCGFLRPIPLWPSAAAALHVPNPGSGRDALIAATALVHGMTVVTRNVSHFRATGVTVVNPWQV